MTKSKRFGVLLLAAFLLLVLAIGVIDYNSLEAQAADSANHYYRSKLMQAEVLYDYPGADIIYDALENMDFAVGAKMQISDDGIQDLAKDHVAGGKKLFNAFGAALGSFRFDHTDYFYVDFDKLSYNVYKDGENYVVELGAGRAENYFVDGVTAADIPELVAEYESALDSAVNYVAGKIPSNKGSYSLTYWRALYANLYLCDNISYGFGTDASGKATAKAAWVATPYGALVSKECICEGYSRAFKAIMDKFGEQCLLVTGYLLKGDGAAESHMWNVLKNGTYTEYIKGVGTTYDAWYAIDVTANDSSRYQSSANQWSNGDYFMQTGDFFDADHIYEKKISSASYEMPYPNIVTKVQKYITGLYKAQYQMYNGTKYPDYKGKTMLVISLAKPLAEMEADGFYPAYGGVYNGKVTWSTFSYMLANYEGLEYFWLEGNVIYLNNLEEGSSQSLPAYKIGLFDIPQDVKAQYYNPKYHPPVMEYDRYSDNAVLTHLIEEQSFDNPLYNPTFVIPAFIDYAQSTPRLTMTMHDITKTLDVKVVYTQKLIQVDNSLAYDDVNNITWRSNPFFASLDPQKVKALTKLEDFLWDGNRTITFKLTVPIGYQYNRSGYEFELTNFVGDCSDQPDVEGKVPVTPNNFGIYFRFHDELACTKCSPDGKMKVNTYGMPILTSTSDLSLDNWSYEDENGEERQISDNQRSQLALVVNKVTAESESGAAIQEALESSIQADENIENGAVVSSATYEIDLTLCGKYAKIPNGSHVTVNFGFPDGMSAADEGVTFKVYHFKRKADNTLDYDHPEILDCIVTEYGITVYMDSFSPFVLVKFDSEKITTAPKKGIVVEYNAVGGTIQGPVLGTTAALVGEGESAIYNIIPKEGYEVEYAILNGNVLSLNGDRSAMSYTFDYDTLADNNVLSVGFVAKTVKAEEATLAFEPTILESTRASSIVTTEIEASSLPEPEAVKEIVYDTVEPTPDVPQDEPDEDPKGDAEDNQQPIIKPDNDATIEAPEDDNASENLGLIIGASAAAGAAVAGGVTATVIIIRKKRKIKAQ